MKKLTPIILVILSFLNCGTLNAQEFFDTSRPSNLFNLSVRVGFNTSNRTFPSGAYNAWNHNSWGLGFNMGVVADINIKDYLSIQPGLFYESRSGDFAYLTNYLDIANQTQTHYELGHLRAYYLTVPIMMVFKLNLSSKIKWLIDLGPYYQLKLKETGNYDISVLYRLPESTTYGEYKAENKNYDVGLKIGSGLQFLRHYYIGVHYLAGFMDAWKLPAGGRNKSWEFTIGYEL